MKPRDQVLLEEAYQSILLNKGNPRLLTENPEFIADSHFFPL
jgi:hypothetical protein